MSFNQSEERLGKLARKTFLSMWTYQNPHYAKGKELCDTLIVFGNDVIIISDKLTKFDETIEPGVAWKRWYKKAVSGSIRQLRGALNQINRFPQNIYCDVQASSPLPLTLPNPESMRVHLVAVANGSEQICLKELGQGGLTIDTSCTNGELHLTVGTNFPEFIHVITKTALEAIFDCFDTVSDLVDYLYRKQQFLSSGERQIIYGEENLVAAYMMSQPGNQKFRIPTEYFPINNRARLVKNHFWGHYIESGLRNEREKIRSPSRAIDRIIEHIAEEYQKGSLIKGQSKPLSYHERAFRIIASESRVGRQLISQPLLDIINENPSTFWCSITNSHETAGLMYLWLIYPNIPEEVTDEELETTIDRHLREYITVALHKFPEAKMIFGICLPNDASTRRSISFRVADDTARNQNTKEEAQMLEKEFGILNDIQTYTQASIRI